MRLIYTKNHSNVLHFYFENVYRFNYVFNFRLQAVSVLKVLIHI